MTALFDRLRACRSATPLLGVAWLHAMTMWFDAVQSYLKHHNIHAAVNTTFSPTQSRIQGLSWLIARECSCFASSLIDC